MGFRSAFLSVINKIQAGEGLGMVMKALIIIALLSETRTS